MSHNINTVTPSGDGLNGDSEFAAFMKKLLENNGEVLYTKDLPDDKRTVKAAWLKALARDGVLSRPIHIRYAIIEGDLKLQYVTFKSLFAITESTFLGKVNLSFAKFNWGINLKASRFEQEVDFRAVRSTGDFRIPLACFKEHACFEDIYVDEVFTAEGASFKKVHFRRAHFSKNAMFSGALIEDGKKNRRLVPTRFEEEANFSDACFKGPTYFKGVCFEKKAIFDRIHIESSGFFDCDSTGDLQIDHKLHTLTEVEIKRESRALLRPEYCGEVSFAGARTENSLAFSGAHFKKKADFRRLQVVGTAIFYPYSTNENTKDPKVFEPVRFHDDADFWNADIKGAARFNAVYFGGKANFEHARVGRGAFFRAITEHKKLHRVIFVGETSFLDAEINGSLVCNGAWFLGNVKFSGVRIVGTADFQPVVYNDQLRPVLFNDDVTFIDAYVKGGLTFDGARFNTEASFERMITDGTAFFRVAKYENFAETKYSKPVAQAEEPKVTAQEKERAGKLIPVRFYGPVRFVGARIKGSAEFDGVQFYDKVSFEHMAVSTDIYFRPWEVGASPARFCKKSNFIGVIIKGAAEFSGTIFEQSADFTGMQVGGNAYFDSQHHFVEDDNLDYWHEKRKISPVEFQDEVQFNGAIFRNEVDFKGARFVKKANFTGVRVEGPVYFYETKFKGDVVFREARFTSLFFNRPDLMRKGLIKTVIDEGLIKTLKARTKILVDKVRGKPCVPDIDSQFQGNVDFGGCSYERMGVKLVHLLCSMKPVRSSRDEPYEDYNRQPYTHLTKALRAVGDDRRADEVYLKQRHLERANTRERSKTYLKSWQLWKATRGFANYVVDCMFWLTGKYGVQPERLFVISAIIIFIGTLIFAQPYAVKTKSAEREAPKGVVAYVNQGEGRQEIEMREREGEANDLHWKDALRFSVSQFIPIVDIPSGSKWRINENGYFKFKPFDIAHIPYDFYGSIHRVLGAILVPLLIAALAGALYRRIQKDL